MTVSKRSVLLDGKPFSYELQYKRVKNVNLRIRSDGSVYVSANKKVPVSFIDSFVTSRAQFILSALAKYKNTDRIPQMYFTEDELKEYIRSFCERIYPYYQKLGFPFPTIKFRRMTSRWGSCNPKKHILNFNLNLLYAQKECVEYVVFHEFTHFLRADHSVYFYRELEKVCSDWQEKRKKLKTVLIPR